MKLRALLTALSVALLSALLLAPTASFAAPKAKLLRNVPVSGTLEDGGSFTGKVTITRFGYDQVKGLWVSGILKGTAVAADGTTYTDISQSFSQSDTTLSQGAAVGSLGVQAQASCSILNLDIGEINLDLLGLVVELSPISLDITAVSGPGNLLGNLLCAVAGLLDPGSGLLILIGNLTQLLDLLNQINQLI